jgi:hypothetical protein
VLGAAKGAVVISNYLAKAWALIAVAGIGDSSALRRVGRLQVYNCVSFVYAVVALKLEALRQVLLQYSNSSITLC